MLDCLFWTCLIMSTVLHCYLLICSFEFLDDFNGMFFRNHLINFTIEEDRWNTGFNSNIFKIDLKRIIYLASFVIFEKCIKVLLDYIQSDIDQKLRNIYSFDSYLFGNLSEITKWWIYYDPFNQFDAINLFYSVSTTIV